MKLRNSAKQGSTEIDIIKSWIWQNPNRPLRTGMKLRTEQENRTTQEKMGRRTEMKDAQSVKGCANRLSVKRATIIKVNG